MTQGRYQQSTRNVSILISALLLVCASRSEAFSTTKLPCSTTTRNNASPHHRRHGTEIRAALSSLPKGINPFEKSLSKNIDVQDDFRKRAKSAVDAALSDGLGLMELEFPPLIGGDKSKSQFDDFDNIQELDKNKEWTMQFAPLFLGDEEYQAGKSWLIFPDLKECELAKEEWAVLN